MKPTILENRNMGFRAGTVVIKDNKILLMHQFLGPQEGKDAEDFYTLPGGSWESNETLEQTCKRELKEECNLDIEVGKLIFLIDTVSRIAFYFECTANSMDISLGGPEKDRMTEHEQYHVEWVEIEKLKSLAFIPAPAKDAIFKFVSNPKQPTFFLSANR